MYPTSVEKTVHNKGEHMSFENMKKRNTSDLISRLSASEEKKSYKDDRFWKPSLDDAGTGSAIIRFLPSLRRRR